MTERRFPVAVDRLAISPFPLVIRKIRQTAAVRETTQVDSRTRTYTGAGWYVCTLHVTYPDGEKVKVRREGTSTSDAMAKAMVSAWRRER